MLRMVVLAAVIVLAWVVVMQLMKSVRARRLDWHGLAVMVAFVALAFYLRHLTGMG